MRNLRLFLFLLLPLALFAACSGSSDDDPASPASEFTLQVLHSSDNESSFQDPNTLETKFLNYATITEGLQMVADAEGIPTLHLTAGDHTLPGPFYQAAAEVPSLGAPGLGDIAAFNALGLRANGMGNHEFDGGIDDFARMLAAADYPFVAANLDFSNATTGGDVPPITIGVDGGSVTENAGTVVKSAYVEIGGERIGLVGRAPADFFNVISDPENTLPGLDFVGGRDPDTNQPLVSAVGQVLEQVELLESQGINKIILIDHAQDFTGDPLSANALRGIDIIVAAGSTGFMAKSAPDGPFNLLRPEDTPEADYPTVREDGEGNPALVVNSDQQFRYVGNLMVTFDAEGRIASVDDRSGPVATTGAAIAALEAEVGATLAPTPGVAETFDALVATDLIQEQFEVVGATAGALNGNRADVRSRETNLGRLAADSTLWFARRQFPDRTVDVALKNGGGIRDTILGPSITRLTVGAALAFDNKLAVVTLTGAEMIAAMENAVSRTPALDGRFPQVAGMYLEYDENQPGVSDRIEMAEPSRLRNLWITRADGTVDVLVNEFAAVGDLSRTFTLATNDFLLTGGDGYQALKAASELRGADRTEDIGERRILVDYIQQALGGTVDLPDPSPVPRVERTSMVFAQSVASGDPRPESVILWTRATDANRPGMDLPVELTVARDADFENVTTRRTLTARAEHDHCVKVRVEGLEPLTPYHYRFSYTDDAGTEHLSRTGRTLTAPAEGTNADIRFAFFSCQDYIGRYYNSFTQLLSTYSPDDLDMLVYTGDYIYETTGDPFFQSPGGARDMVFQDIEGAIQLGDPAAPFHAAASLANYRTLYKTYRSDPMLRRLQERFPILVFWDDHEYSNDNWGPTATYRNGRIDETDPERKRNAERAFFEYIPIEIGLDAGGELSIGEDILWPNTRIYRAFDYGRNLDLILTDYRTYRPDHLIPEDAFPGTIVMDENQSAAVMGDAFPLYRPALEPYANLDAAESAPVRGGLVQILAAAYLNDNPFLGEAEALLVAESAASGNVSANVVNLFFQGAGQPAPFDAATLETLPRGVAFATLGKGTLYDSVGARNVVTQDIYTFYAGFLNTINPDSEDVYGAEQETWFRNRLSASEATWKIFAHSVSFTPMMLDLTKPEVEPLIPPEFPAALRTRLMLNPEQMDGFPNKKNEILGFLSQIPGAAIIAGDIHAAFVGDHGDRGGVNRVYEFTGTGVSSATFAAGVKSAVDAIGIPGADALLTQLDPLLQLSSVDNPFSSPSTIVYNNTNVHGYVVIEAAADALTATFHHYPVELVTRPFYATPDDLLPSFEERRFQVAGGALTPLN